MDPRPVHIALTVGVDTYNDPLIGNLQCARRDAEALAFRLRDCDFTTSPLTQNLSVDGVIAHLHDLGRKLKPGGLFLFFFAGHGKTVTRPDGSQDHLLLLPMASHSLLASGHLLGGPGLLSLRVLKELTDHWQGVRPPLSGRCLPLAVGVGVIP